MNKKQTKTNRKALRDAVKLTEWDKAKRALAGMRAERDASYVNSITDNGVTRPLSRAIRVF